MTSLQSLYLIMTHVRTNWEKFTVGERAVVFVLSFLAVCMTAATFWAANLFSVVVCLLWIATLAGCAYGVLAIVLRRVAEMDMTSQYLDQFGQVHVLDADSGDRYTFVSGSGWEYVPPREEL